MTDTEGDPRVMPMNITRTEIRLAGLVAAGVMGLTALTIAIIPAVNNGHADPSNAASTLMSVQWGGLDAEEQGYACNIWINDRDSAQLTWAQNGANRNGVAELTHLMDNYCTLEV